MLHRKWKRTNRCDSLGRRTKRIHAPFLPWPWISRHPQSSFHVNHLSWDLHTVSYKKERSRSLLRPSERPLSIVPEVVPLPRATTFDVAKEGRNVRDARSIQATTTGIVVGHVFVGSHPILPFRNSTGTQGKRMRFYAIFFHGKMTSVEREKAMDFVLDITRSTKRRNPREYKRDENQKTRNRGMETELVHVFVGLFFSFGSILLRTISDPFFFRDMHGIFLSLLPMILIVPGKVERMETFDPIQSDPDPDPDSKNKNRRSIP